MMQLLCNGVVLDLYENTGLQMKVDNPLFAFDKIACERTTNFKLPATSTNDRVLSLARVPAYKGDGMRRKFSAQLQLGTVVKDGYLYVSNFDGKDYNAIFVTGELLGLQQIKDLGKLCEIIEYPETVSASYAVKPANDATFKTSVFDVYRYEGSEGVTIFPSINVGKLIDKICAHIGVQCATPEKTYEMRLACPSLRVPEKIEGAHIKSTRTGGDPYNTIFADLLARGIIEERVLVARRTLVWHNGYSVTGDVLETQTYDVNVTHFRTLDSIEITFPEDFPERLFLCYMNPLVSGQCVFLGDYSFTRPTPTTTGEAGVVVSGEPLAGRTVEIPAGTSFILVREDGYAQPSGQNDYQCNAVQTYWGDDAIPAVLVTRGWDFVNGLQYDYEVDVDFNEEGATVYRMQDNLPDITFVELLKAVAAELGLVLRYSDAEGLTFDVLPIDTYSVLEVGQIMKRGEVTRTFADYAQRNAVSYKEDDVFPNNETPAIYTIDNDNISEEKDLQVLPWTNGGQYIRSAGVVVWDKAGRSEFLEIRYNAGGIAALRASISKNESIQRLCDASTQIKIESRMPLPQYERLKPDMGLLLDNSTYLWTDKQWQKDIAKLTLAQYAKVPSFIHLLGVRFSGLSYFPLNHMSFLNGDFELEWEIANGAPLSPLILYANGLQNSPECGVWAWAGTYTIRLRFPVFFPGNAAYGERIRLTVLNDAVTYYKNNEQVGSSHAGTLGAILDTEEFGIGAAATQNGNYNILTNRQFQGMFFGFKDGNGNYIIEPCIYNGVVGLYNHAAGIFIPPVGDSVEPIYN